MIALQVVSCFLCNRHPCELTAEPCCSALALLRGELADSIWCNLLMEPGWVCIKTVCECVCVRAPRTASFHSSPCVSKTEKEGGVGRSMAGVICAACHDSFSRQTAFVACKINTLQYLRKAGMSSEPHAMTIWSAWSNDIMLYFTTSFI